MGIPMPAARLPDMHVCPLVTGVVPHVGGPIIGGCFTVLIGGLPAARMTDMCVCVGPPDMSIMGEFTCLIGGLPAARMTDMTAHGGLIVLGCFTVLIRAMGGGGGAAAAGGSPIDDPAVKAGVKQAWEDPQAGDPSNRHEEGYYIVKNAHGTYGVERWPRGAGASIAPPARDASGKYNGKEVVGEFHTHPNPPVDESGKAWTQGGHQGDWDGIKAENYPGDSYIISRDNVWKVSKDGTPTTDAAGNEVPYGTREGLLGR